MFFLVNERNLIFVSARFLIQGGERYEQPKKRTCWLYRKML